MPQQIKNVPICGISADFAFKGDRVAVEIEGFYSTEDGAKFLAIAEDMTNVFHKQLADINGRPSQIDNLLITLDREGNGLFYYNELAFILGMRGNRDIQRGDLVTEDDINDIEELHMRLAASGASIDPPKTNAIFFLFSYGWRKGIYFNFGPMRSNPDLLPELPGLLGNLYCHVAFQQKFSISDDQWSRLFDWEWFPFSCLSKHEMRELIEWSRQDRVPEPVFAEICTNYKARLPVRIDLWKRRVEIADHVAFIDSAYNSYTEDNYLASMQTLMPRIEGIMRVQLNKQNPNRKIQQGSMVQNLVSAKADTSLLLPDKFQKYLVHSYFRDFDRDTQSGDLSRHTIGHGVSKAEDYTFVRNTLMFMIFDEIVNYLPVTTSAQNNTNVTAALPK